RKPDVRHKAARVHQVARQRGGMAVCRARAAGGQAADHRVPGSEYGVHPKEIDRRFRAAAARTWLDRESNRRHRVSLGRGTRRAFRRDRGWLRTVAILANISSPNSVLEMAEAQAAARTLGLAVVTSDVRGAEDIAPAFDALKGRADALYVCGSPLMTTNR